MRTASPALLSDYLGDAAGHGSVRTTPSPARTAPTVSVIIPTLNEAGNLPYVLNTIPRWVDEVVIVDGRSSDDTARIARVLRPDARIVHQMRKGKGAALRAGLDSARGELLIIMDADGSMDGADIEKFRDALVDGADYVKGSRFCDGGGSTDITRLRRFGDAGICFLIWLFFGAQVHRRDLRLQGHVGEQPRRDPHRHRRVRGRAAHRHPRAPRRPAAPRRSRASRPTASMGAAT